MQLGTMSKTTRVSNAVAAGTTDINSTGIDMQNFEGVAFEVLFGAITAGAVTSIKLQQSDDDGSSDAYSDLEGSAVTVADDDDNQVFIAEVYRPRKRWVRAVVDRATQNAVVDGIVARQYSPRQLPVSQPPTTTQEVNISPAEGTA